MTTELNQITIVQYPIIQHKLKEAAEIVKKRIADLELDTLVATEDTVKALKATRAELNKESASLDTYIKEALIPLKSPITELEDEFKNGIKRQYQIAETLLKDKIAVVENKVKSEKKKNLELYFDELCVSEKIDFIKFAQLGIEVNLSVTEKKYKEQINEYITRVIDDLILIKSTDYEAETLTEYKTTLNASKAITTVKTRKEEEAKETERLKAAQTVNRKNFLTALGMKYEEITNAYEYNADIYVTVSDINTLSKDDFTKKYHECEAKINQVKADELAATKAAEPEQNQAFESPISAPVAAPIAAPISAPTVETVKETEPLKKASFEVTATMTQLRALGQYMRDAGITYKNI